LDSLANLYGIIIFITCVSFDATTSAEPISLRALARRAAEGAMWSGWRRANDCAHAFQTTVLSRRRFCELGARSTSCAGAVAPRSLKERQSVLSDQDRFRSGHAAADPRHTGESLAKSWGWRPCPHIPDHAPTRLSDDKSDL